MEHYTEIVYKYYVSVFGCNRLAVNYGRYWLELMVQSLNVVVTIKQRNQKPLYLLALFSLMVVVERTKSGIGSTNQ